MVDHYRLEGKSYSKKTGEFLDHFSLIIDPGLDCGLRGFKDTDELKELYERFCKTNFFVAVTVKVEKATLLEKDKVPFSDKHGEPLREGFYKFCGGGAPYVILAYKKDKGWRLMHGKDGKDHELSLSYGRDNLIRASESEAREGVKNLKQKFDSLESALNLFNSRLEQSASSDAEGR